MSNEENPWTDDRSTQSSLLGDQEATRTADRSGEVVTGSSEFADDRDDRARSTSSGPTGDQANLFTETEEMEGQAALGGGTATREDTGIIEEIEEESRTFEDETGAVDTGAPDLDYQGGFESGRLEPETVPDQLPTGFELDEVSSDNQGRIREADYTRPSELPGVESDIIRVQDIQGRFEVFQAISDDDKRASPAGTFGDDFDAALGRAESLAERRDPIDLDRDDQGDGDRDQLDDQELLELDGRAARAGITATKLAESQADDLDGDILDDVRGELEELSDDGGTLELDSEELEELNDAVAEFGATASPAQRPQGFDVLEERVFETDTATELDRAAAGHAVEKVVNKGEDVEPIEFARREAANEARDLVPDEALVENDRRKKTVKIRTDRVDERTLNRVSGEAADSKAFEEAKTGQVGLTERERKEIDFKETSVPEARSVKAIMASEGVDDWLSFFDPTLTVDENRGLAKRAAKDDRGKRMEDQESAVEKEARGRRREAEELERFARKGAEAGEREAIETLVKDLGWNREDARALAHTADDDEERGKVLDTVVARALANGQFLAAPPERAPDSPSKYRSQTSGHFVGDKIDRNPGIVRDPADGRFMLDPTRS
jgi:hypothetical protein